MSKVFLLPGKYWSSSTPSEVITVLGSCVAVVLHDSKLKVSGMNHFLLPHVHEGDAPSARYGNVAMPTLISAMEILGCSKKRLRAKVYGGAGVLKDLTVGTQIGLDNISCALDYLMDQGIPVVEKNVAGNQGRKIILQSETFEVKHESKGRKGKQGELIDVTGFGHLIQPSDIRVLIVDDSATVREIFRKVFAKHGLTVVGAAANAYEARKMVIEKKPTVLTLDIEMPYMSGVAFLEKIMKHKPMPVVMVSSLSSQGDAALRSMELGAVEFVEKPSQFDPSALRSFGEIVVEKVRAAAATPTGQVKAKPRQPLPFQGGTTKKGCGSSGLNLIVVGGHTGSQESLTSLLSSLPSDTPPVVVVNSTISTFIENYIAKIKKQCQVSLFLGCDGQRLQMGSVYFAPPAVHTKVKKELQGFALKTEKAAPVASQIPSITVLFDSASLIGSEVLGILLGGFGGDGVEGMVNIHRLGGDTMVENPSDCSFPFIPQKAIELGVVEQIRSAEQMSAEIMQYRGKRAA